MGLRDMRAACSSGDDLVSLRNGHKLFKNITAVTNSNRDKIEKILADGASKIKVAQDRFASYVPEKHKHKMDEKNKERGIIDAKLSQKWAAKEQTENDIAQMQNKLKKINQDFKQN